MVASARERPDSNKNSKTASKLPESERSSSITGKMLLSAFPKTFVETTPCRAVIALTFPRSVLISPL